MVEELWDQQNTNYILSLRTYKMQWEETNYQTKNLNSVMSFVCELHMYKILYW